jgi:hypothetical protein
MARRSLKMRVLGVGAYDKLPRSKGLLKVRYAGGGGRSWPENTYLGPRMAVVPYLCLYIAVYY